MTRQTLVIAVLILLLTALPLVAARHTLDLMIFAALYSIAGLGVGLLLGQCGIVNLAQAFFYGIGAYASAYGTVMLEWSPWLGILVGMVTAGLVALAIGWPILRLSGFFLALATLAVGTIGTILFFEWDWLTGGTLGIGGLPPLSIAGFAFDTPVRFYYLAWVIALAALGLAWNLTQGRPGLAMRAVRDAAPAAEGLGVDIHAMRVKVFVIGAVLGALAGSLFAHHVTYVSVESFTVQRSIVFLLIPVIAGARMVWGVIPGALFITFVPEWLARFGDMHQMLFGIVLVLVVVLLPEGLTGLPARLRRRTAA
ncbi:branched-chain amino acid ABC transporter permease [Haematobacter massiliensis]|uniref:branched-chain amino acid ABC transporter permease n=1 Tax=Haematobacter massiliensis TaxID=195105 RepID=UPI000B49C93D|nr:branched-chain amino acid ABC transporter permease [Haematobacter massiliensis]OWJ69385.1 branched-chain amino acid ABC transporter permease [Haematobacter massiliensis]QBJ25528.1 branched-chain amino acid ABC transporter permease [Haematobacter massiliensis]